MAVRPFQAGDTEATYQVFFDAVRIGAKARYTAAQREAWAPHDTPSESWAEKLGNAVTFVAEVEGRVTGFMSVLAWAHVDMAYVAPDQMGNGTALDLYDAIEGHVRKQGLIKMTTEASHLAKPFFERQGWQVEAAQLIQREGIDIPNFRMFKDL